MKLAIMQPYFLPYIGYFQLMAAADQFIVYDNIKYTKKGWINRNRMLMNDADAIFTLPLKKDADNLNIVDRELAANFDSRKLLNQFKGAYARAPYFENIYPLLDQIINYQKNNLFDYIHYSIMRMCEYLDIKTQILVASNITIDHSLKGRDKVLALCNATNAKIYINSIGGVELYAKDDFSNHGIHLQFIKSLPLEYMQFRANFVPWLSIIDVLMFMPLDAVRASIHENYELI